MSTDNPFEGVDHQEAMDVLAGLAARNIEEALSPALEGGRVQSCLHIADLATGLVVDQKTTAGHVVGQSIMTDRTAYLCVWQPGYRIFCDKPGNEAGPGCAEQHRMEHKGEYELRCYICEAPIEEALLTPVFIKIALHKPLKVYADWKSRYEYESGLRTFPIAYLCPSHSHLFDVHNPWVWHWPVPSADGLTPEDIIGR